MEVPLLIDPQMAEIKATGDTSIHQVLNTSRKRLAFKIKSTNNKDYVLQPVYGFVEPGTSQSLVITRKAGPAAVDKLVVEFLEAPATSKNAQLFWRGRKAAGEVIVPMIST